MTDLDLNLAPGCFGSALTYIEGSVECGSCLFAARCKPLHDANLATLRARLKLPASPQRKRVERKEEPAATLAPAPLPSQVEEMIGRIERAGIKVTEALAAGRNPFDSRFSSLRVACHLLLNMRSVGRETLVMALEKKLHMGRVSATSRAKHLVQLLVAVGAATETNNKLTLKR